MLKITSKRIIKKENHFFKIFIVFAFFLSNYSICQETKEVYKTQIMGLTYHPEIPDSTSYSIIKNMTDRPVDEEVLKQINLYRRNDEDYVWVVNDNIEILIKKIEK